MGIKELQQAIQDKCREFVENESLLTMIQQALIARFEQEFFTAQQDNERKLSKLTSEFNISKSTLLSRLDVYLRTIKEQVDLCGQDFSYKNWGLSVWRDWQNGENLQKKLEDRELKSFESMKALFPISPYISESILCGSVDIENRNIPIFYSPMQHRNVVITTRTPDKDVIYDFTYNMILRILTASAPGNINLCIIDPVKLGEKLGTYTTVFRELPRAKSIIIGGLAITEERQIEDVLSQLRTKISEIVQLMGNQYKDLTEYNKNSVEVQEPYRFLVIRDFPKSFSKNSIEKLISIMSAGPRCGVFTILHIDEMLLQSDTERSNTSSIDIGKQYQLRIGITRDQITHNNLHISEINNMYTYNYTSNKKDNNPYADMIRVVNHLPVKFISTPPQRVAIDVVNSIATMQAIGSNIKINLPVSNQSLWWKNSTLRSISVQSGVTGQSSVQSLELSDAQVGGIIVGRAGSGKTNLLHVIIQQLCIKYSPDELQLYLIDLKRSEFRPYGEYGLPHAKVVASKVDRKFCLSVLQDLVNEMERRDKIFAQAANRTGKTINNIISYREATNANMPRIVLIADEFTVLFSEGDTTADYTRRTIELIAKQGRSFGIHMLLCSQVVLPKQLPDDIKDQLAIRIALMCSDSTSEALFGSSNRVTKLLKRPGEAIFNFVAGSEEGNRHVQVYHQEDTTEYLQSLLRYTQSQRSSISKPIIFMGDKTADYRDNPVFAQGNRLVTIQGRDIKLYFGQEFTLEGEHVAVNIGDSQGDNTIIIGARSYETYVAQMITAMVSTTIPQLFPNLLNISLSDNTFDPDNNNNRIVPYFQTNNISYNDITNNLQDRLVDIASQIYRYSLGQEVASAAHIIILAGLPRNLSNPIRKKLNKTKEDALVGLNNLEETSIPLNVDFSQANPDALNKNAETLRLLAQRNIPMKRKNEVNNVTDTDSFPIDNYQNYLQLLMYILENGPYYHVHVVLYVDGVDTLQQTIGSKQYIERLFNSRIIYPMVMNDINRIINETNNVTLVSKLTPISQSGDWTEPRVFVYDRMNNKAVTVRPYGIS